MATRSSVEQFLSQKSLAVAGASRGGKKFGNAVLKDLRKKGYAISLIHPEAKEIEGLPCHASISELASQVGGLVLVVPPEQTKRIVHEAVAVGIRNIWMQQGSESPEAVQLCQEKGTNVIHGECILMYAQPRAIHAFHRWLWKVLGKAPQG